MAFQIPKRTIPQCSACIQNHIRNIIGDVSGPVSSLRQQIRGKKKMVNNTGTSIVQLLKDKPEYGRKGSFVPIPTGLMRNKWFPERIAEYVSKQELKALKLNNISTERDLDFGITEEMRAARRAAEGGDEMEELVTEEEIKTEPRPRPVGDIELSQERSRELIEIFIPKRLDFPRTAIAGNKPEDQRSAFSAGAELLAARTGGVGVNDKLAPIYGSVTLHDVAVVMRAAMDTNDEARRVVINQDDLTFIDLPASSEADADRIKNIGDFVVELKLKNMTEPVVRTIRVVPKSF